jgi:site-specific recombinase XerD
MATLTDDVLAHLSPKLATSTRAQYRVAAGKLKEILAEFAPQQVTQRDVVQIKLALAHTPNMANRIISFLRQVFDYALELEIVDDNPCRSVRRLVEAKRGRYLTDDEYRAIYAKPGLRGGSASLNTIRFEISGSAAVNC